MLRIYRKRETMKKAAIYTGTGDSGTTSLCGGKRVPKEHPRVEAYGTLDELNAHIGLLVASLDDEATVDFITAIENDIFTIGCHLAAEDSNCPIGDADVERLERAIDAIDATLPEIRSFILPANSEQAARANVCRTICRRAERQMTTLAREHDISPKAMVYINRLSDYLFLLQRQLQGGEEKMWQKPCE